MILCNEDREEEVRRRLHTAVRLLDHQAWLINSFVLDFFLCSHWSRLPPSWRPTLSSTTPEHLAAWLRPSSATTTSPSSPSSPWPLALLALRAAIRAVALPREPVGDLKDLRDFLGARGEEEEEEREKVGEEREEEEGKKWELEPELLSAAAGCHPSLRHVFRKHVKPKKQHEMCRLAKLVDSVGGSQGCARTLDIGAGAGHLSRYLAYNFQHQVACVDGDGELTSSARKFDQELEVMVEKMVRRGEALDLVPGPTHVTCHLAPDMDLHQLHQVLGCRFSVSGEELQYNLVGLHTCGDLGPVILNMFAQDPRAATVASVGCCYMKLQEHFPMSSYLKGVEWGGLSYVSEELACHAIETYTQRLLLPQEKDKLRVHCYRAVLEELLVRREPRLRHTILRTVPSAHTMPFPEYASRATSRLVEEGALEELGEEELTSKEVEERLERWWEVVTFYTLRLALAPVIETVILLDRQLFLLERGQPSIMLPIFDPTLSPRNQVIVAVKNTRKGSK